MQRLNISECSQATNADLSHKIDTTLQPVFLSTNIEQYLKPKEIKPQILNQQCVVYVICVMRIM